MHMLTFSVMRIGKSGSLSTPVPLTKVSSEMLVLQVLPLLRKGVLGETHWMSKDAWQMLVTLIWNDKAVNGIAGIVCQNAWHVGFFPRLYLHLLWPLTTRCKQDADRVGQTCAVTLVVLGKENCTRPMTIVTMVGISIAAIDESTAIIGIGGQEFFVAQVDPVN